MNENTDQVRGGCGDTDLHKQTLEKLAKEITKLQMIVERSTTLGLEENPTTDYSTSAGTD